MNRDFAVEKEMKTRLSTLWIVVMFNCHDCLLQAVDVQDKPLGKYHRVCDNDSLGHRRGNTKRFLCLFRHHRSDMHAGDYLVCMEVV
jgi:hypothetical protein